MTILTSQEKEKARKGNKAKRRLKIMQRQKEIEAWRSKADKPIQQENVYYQI